MGIVIACHYLQLIVSVLLIVNHCSSPSTVSHSKLLLLSSRLAYHLPLPFCVTGPFQTSDLIPAILVHNDFSYGYNKLTFASSTSQTPWVSITTYEMFLSLQLWLIWRENRSGRFILAKTHLPVASMINSSSAVTGTVRHSGTPPTIHFWVFLAGSYICGCFNWCSRMNLNDLGDHSVFFQYPFPPCSAFIQLTWKQRFVKDIYEFCSLLA